MNNVIQFPRPYIKTESEYDPDLDNVICLPNGYIYIEQTPISILGMDEDDDMPMFY